MAMSKNNLMAMIADLHNINRVMKKVELEESRMRYGCNRKKEDLKIIGIFELLFKTDAKSIGRIILLLLNRDLTKARPIHWKLKPIERVCHSSKDEKTLILNKLVEDAVFAVEQIEKFIFGEYKKRLLIHLFMDLEETLESITSTNQVDRNSLRIAIQNLKKRLIDGDKALYQWILTDSM